MKISVIIPTYRPASYLWKCLKSLEEQTLSHSEFEVILILNGCDEPYKSQIENFLTHTTLNVNLIQIDIPGVSNARNIGLDNAKGEYIAFIDDDDYVSPSYLEELLKVSSADTIGLSYPYAFNDGEDMTQITHYSITETYNKFSYYGRQPYSFKIRRYFSGPWMKLIHINLIQGRRFDIRFSNGEDGLFMFAISDKFKFVDFTSKKSVYYRRYRPNSAVTRKDNLGHLLSIATSLSCAYLSLYFSKDTSYNFVITISRVLASYKSAFYRFFKYWKN